MSPNTLLRVAVIVGATLLVGPMTCGASGPTPSAATQKSPTPISVIPSDWYKTADISIEPAHAQYLGGTKELSQDPKHPGSEHAHFIAWGKFEYKEPQKAGDKQFTTELVAVHIDCAKSTYSQFRDIKMDQDGKIIDDSSKASKFEPIKLGVHLGLLQPPAATAANAAPQTCGKDAD